MALRRAVVLVVLATFLGLPRSAAATVSVSPALSYDGSYTVSWTDWSSGQTRAYLYQSFNGGAYTRVTVTGTYSRAYTGMALGDYKYQIKIYFYEPEDRLEYFQSQTNIVTVTVTSAGAPGTPGAITGPTSSSTGSYALGWGASSGTVSSYELQQNGTLVYTGTALSTTLNGRSDGTYRYRVRACNAAGCGEFTAELVVTVLLLPAAPNPVSAPAQSASGVYAVSWTKPSGFVVDGYRIERRLGTGPWSATEVGPEASYTYSQSIDGTYFHRVYARNASGLGPASNEVAVVVELQLTETLPDSPAVQPNVPAQQWVGTLPGIPSVEGGSATYRIPIDVPPGRAGMQPELALTYGSRNGNGLLGVGWSISGTSSVYRCPRTLAQDGGNAPVRLRDDDRLCFDGKRLVLVAGSYGQDASEYRTETDPFDRITLRGGAMGSWGSFFEVEHKSGLRSHFVAMRQSSTSPLPPATWQLARQFDRQGNCLAYEFTLFHSRGDDEEWVLSTIKYPGSMSGSQCVVPTMIDGTLIDRGVYFAYTADREDKRTTYQAGAASMMTARLSAITTRASGYPVRQYALAYKSSAATGRSLLTSVRLCAGATCTGPQLPPTVFTYQYDSPNFSGLAQVRLASGATLGEQWTASVIGDFDGDGTREKLFSTDTIPNTRTLELSSCGTQTEIDGNAWFPGFESPGDANPKRAQDDLNNDGRADLLGSQHDGTGYVAAVGTHTCNGWRIEHPTAGGAGMPLPAPIATTVGTPAGTGDPDGNGLVDIHYLVSQPYPKPTQYFRYRRLSNGALEFAPAESYAPATSANQSARLESDFDGDGRTDVFFDKAQSWQDATPHIAFFRGYGMVPEHQLVNLWDLGGPGDSFYLTQRRWIDVNGDGLLDIYSGTSLWLNRGGGRFMLVSVTPIDVPLDRLKKATVVDIDADGQSELIVPNERVAPTFCGANPYPSREECGGPWCGDDFDNRALCPDDDFDRSVFRWDAYKFRETSAGTYELVLVPTNVHAPSPMNVHVSWQDLSHPLI